MSIPKKGGKPIKITLTEGQLSDIISQTARTRRGLKAESLEDRIAPSVIGAPMDAEVIPTEGETPPEYGEPPVPPPLPGSEPLPYDPTLYDPSLPPGDFDGGQLGDSITPPLPDDPSFVTTDPFSQLPIDPNNPNLPINPDGVIGLPPLPSAPGGFPGTYDGAPGTFGGESGELGGPGQQRQYERFQERSPESLRDDPRAHFRVNQKLQDDLQLNADSGGTPPSPEELETHRRNILRQLRGGPSAPPPEVPPEG